MRYMAKRGNWQKAHTSAYDAARKSVEAVLLSRGWRAGGAGGGHLAVGEVVEVWLSEAPDPGPRIARKFAASHIARHQDEYPHPKDRSPHGYRIEGIGTRRHPPHESRSRGAGTGRARRPPADGGQSAPVHPLRRRVQRLRGRAGWPALAAASRRRRRSSASRARSSAASWIVGAVPPRWRGSHQRSSGPLARPG